MFERFCAAEVPGLRQDLSLVLDKTVSFKQIKQFVERKLLQDIYVFDVYEGDKIEAGKKPSSSASRSWTNSKPSPTKPSKAR